MADTIEIEVKCPVPGCKSKKTINVPSYIFANKEFGTLKIQIHKGIVCPEHQFVIFVDKKGKVRGYEKIDLEIQIAAKAAVDEDLITLTDLVKIMGEFAVLNILHALIMGTKVIIIKKELDEINAGKINATFKNLFPDFYSEKDPIIFKSQSEFERYKDTEALILDEKGYLIHAPWNINKFELEEKILRKTLKSSDFKAQKIIFNQEIHNFIKQAEFTKDLVEKGTVYEEDLIKELSAKFMKKKISDYEFDLIKNILKCRYKFDTSKIKLKSFDKLKEVLW